MTGRVTYLQALKNAHADEMHQMQFGDHAFNWDRFVQSLEHQGWVLRRTVTAQEHEALREVAVRAANGEDVQHRARLALGLSSDPPGPDDHEPPDLQCRQCGGIGVLFSGTITFEGSMSDDAEAHTCPVCDGLGRLT